MVYRIWCRYPWQHSRSLLCHSQNVECRLWLAEDTVEAACCMNSLWTHNKHFHQRLMCSGRTGIILLFVQRWCTLSFSKHGAGRHFKRISSHIHNHFKGVSCCSSYLFIEDFMSCSFRLVFVCRKLNAQLHLLHYRKKEWQKGRKSKVKVGLLQPTHTDGETHEVDTYLTLSLHAYSHTSFAFPCLPI